MRSPRCLESSSVLGAEGPVAPSDRVTQRGFPTQGLDANPKSLLETKRRDGDVRLFKSDNPHGSFGDAVKGRSRTAAPIDAAVRSDTLSFLDQIANKLRRRLRWDPVKEDFVGDTAASALLDRPLREPWRLSTAA